MSDRCAGCWELLRAPKLRRKLANKEPGQLSFFLSGVMGGSSTRIKTFSDIAPQDYRTFMRSTLERLYPGCTIVEPLDYVKSEIEKLIPPGTADSDRFRDDAVVAKLFKDCVHMAVDCDVVISNLPSASMGSAVEIWEAKKHGRIVLTVSPLKDNWLVRTVSDHNFSDLQTFEREMADVLSRLLPSA